jgi:acylphosphatase
MATRQIRVRGLVQGVGYRDALRREAKRAGVTGWVRNRSDGSVEAVLQGNQQAVECLLAWARRGPPSARVDAVEEAPAEPAFDHVYTGFERRPSA